MDNLIYLDNKGFQMRKRPIMCKKCLQFGHSKQYCCMKNVYYEKCARSLQEEEEHKCRDPQQRKLLSGGLPLVMGRLRGGGTNPS